MVWFLAYCFLSVGFFILGDAGLTLHWFWNAVFSLLASGTMTYATHRIVRSRLCPARIRNAVQNQKPETEIRETVEAAFGAALDLDDPTDAWMAGFIAYPPIVIALFAGLGHVIHSGFWRVLITFPISIALAILLGNLMNRIAAQKRMFAASKKAIQDHDSGTWKRMASLWATRNTAGEQIQHSEQIQHRRSHNMANVSLTTSEAVWQIQQGSEDHVKRLVDQGASVHDILDNGATPLHVAASWHRESLVKLFIEKGADVNAKDNDGETPLHWAAGKGHAEMVELLLAHGARVNAKDHLGWTPLHKAAVKHHYQAGSVLLSNGADANAKDNSGGTPLQCAEAWGGSQAVIELLRQHGAR
ncbi:MAG: ankyrin repeat domain-containing protein [Planctomycetes bacterium]|nr:ankyrin repeat domain-containing protein [Planctomycetota bacterium]